jgi:hypothetical protein
MIQRVQSIFLAISIIGMALLCFMPIWEKVNTTTGQSANLAATQLVIQNNSAPVSTPTYAIVGFAVLAIILTAYSLFSFKNRKLQMLLGAIISMVIAITLGFVFYYIFTKGMPAFDANFSGDYGIGFYAGGVALLSNMIANRFIRRDENLVRSADRMR